MALHCRRTPECLYFLSPGAARKRIWLQQSFLCILAGNLATAIIEEPANDLILELAKSTIKTTDAMQVSLKRYNICVPDNFRDEEGQLINLLIKLFGYEVIDGKKTIPIPVHNLAESLVRLADDVIEAVEKYCEHLGIEAEDQTEQILELQALVDQISLAVEDDEESAMTSSKDAYTAFQTLLFGTQKEAPLPSLYEAYGDTVILAYGRGQAKQTLMRLNGWKATNKDIVGISPQEVFGDGRTGMDVIQQYKDSAPCIVGASA